MSNPASGDVTLVGMTDAVFLADLGVRLTRGARVTVPFSSAMKSRDLAAAKADGTVAVHAPRASAVRPPEVVETGRYGLVDLAPLLLAVRQLTEEVRGIREYLAIRGPGTASSDLSSLEALLRRVTAQGAVPGAVLAPPGSVETPSEELFIPSNLTGGSVASLKVSSESSEDRSVEDAMSALRAARRQSGR